MTLVLKGEENKELENNSMQSKRKQGLKAVMILGKVR